MRTAKFVFATALFAMLLSACHKGTEGSARASSGGPIRIGMSFDSLQLERWQRDRAAFVARAKELSADGAVALDMLGRKRSA